MSKWLLLGTAVTLGVISYAPDDFSFSETAAFAAETEPAVTAARKAQLEGTQLQLEGDMQGAVKKYRESLSLSPNAQLEKLVDKLENRIAATDPAAQAAAQGMLEEKKSTAKEGMAHSFKAATPQEQLIDDFLQWMLAFIPPSTKDGLGITFNRDYTVQQQGDHYQTSFSPVTLHGPEGFEVTLSSIDFHFIPQENGQLNVSILLPEQAPFLDNGAEVGSMRIGEQSIQGIWDKNRSNFTQAGFDLGDLTLADLEEKFTLTIQQTGMKGNFSVDPEDHWKLSYTGDLNNLALAVEDGGLSIKHIHLGHDQAGSDAGAITDMQTQTMHVIQQGEQATLDDMKAYFANIDAILQILDAYKTTVRLEGLEAHADQFQMGIGAIYGDSDISKKQGTATFAYHGRGGVENINFSQTVEEENQQAPSGSLKNMQLTVGGSFDTPPPGLFSSLLTEVETLQKSQPEDMDTAMAPAVVKYMKEILKLLKAYNAEISLDGFALENVAPAPISCEKISLNNGFDTGSGNGGTVSGSFNLTGLQGPDIGASPLPQAANLQLQLSNIPDLLQLFPEPATLAQGDEGLMQLELMQKGQALLMSTPLALAITDTYLTFPTTGLTFGLTANMDSAAKFMSSGTLNISLENPEEFKRIIQSISGENSMAQVMGTFTALANRTETDGKIVDTIEAKVDPAGKIFVNAKDVTSMFFPPAGEPPQEAPAVEKEQ